MSWANSLVAVGRNLGIMAGPAIGGLLLAAVGASWVFGLNAASFVVSAALVVSVRARFVGDRSDETEYHGIWAGFRFLLREPVLRRIGAAWVVLVLGIGMAMVGDVPLVEVFDAGSAGFGVMIGLWGAGSILGSLAGRWLSAATEMRWLVPGDRVRRGHQRRDRALTMVRAGPRPERRLGSQRGDHGRRRAEPVPTPDAGLRAEPGPRGARGFVPRRAGRLLRRGGVRARVVGARGMYAIAGGAAALSVVVLLPLLRTAPVGAGDLSSELP